MDFRIPRLYEWVCQHANGDMDYVEIKNFNDASGAYVVDIEVAGVSTVQTVEYTVLAQE